MLLSGNIEAFLWTLKPKEAGIRELAIRGYLISSASKGLLDPALLPYGRFYVTGWKSSRPASRYRSGSFSLYELNR
jgi:hypothetical protein